ncbi:MAG TPA: hypothetical protein VGL49_04920 [Acidimicrobiales bacterium]|jgi:hypothetical protein
MRRLSGLARWMGLAGATFWLDRLGDGPLGAVPWSRPEDYLTWWRTRGPVVASFATARQALFWVGCYLCGLSIVVLSAAALRSVSLTAALVRGHLPGLRIALAVSGATTWAAVSAATADPALAATDQGPGAGAPAMPSVPAGSPVLRWLGPAGAPLGRDAEPAGPPTLRKLGPAAPPTRRNVGPAAPPTRRDAEPGSPPARRTTAPAGPRPHSNTGPVHAPRAVPRLTPIRRPLSSTAPATPEAPIGGGWWTVRPGDDLWSIAAATLSHAWGRPPDLDDLARYWWRVVEANRAWLPDPGDPNLLLPGDRVVVPLTPASPAASGQPPDW